MINSCPICESAGQKELSEIYGFKYKECVKCGTVFVSNPPTEDDRSLTYQSKYYTNANKIVLANDSIIDYRLREIFIPKINFVNEHLTTKKKTWLDIGCGVGEALSAAKSYGFDTFGLEANKMECEYASNHFGIKVRQEYLSENSLTKYQGQYGVISLIDKHNLSDEVLVVAEKYST